MHNSILHEFVGEHVEVYSNGKRFEGILKYDASRSLITMTAPEEWKRNLYGVAIIDTNSVHAIRKILPRSYKSIDSDGDDNVDSNYKEYKKAVKLNEETATFAEDTSENGR